MKISRIGKCYDCKKKKPIKEFMVGGMVSIRCNKCRNKLTKKNKTE